MCARIHHRPAKAFTLIELILALGLSAVLLALLAGALSLGMSRAITSRERVEHARLVEGVISVLRDDVYRTVIYDPQETAAAMELAESLADFDVDSLDDISSSGSSAEGGRASSGSGTSTGSESQSSNAGLESESLRQPLGLYGTLTELQIDVLREHPNFELDASGGVVAATGVSGITTIRYALGQGTPTLATNTITGDRALGSGLTRQEVSRDLLSWAQQTGNAAQVAGTPLLIAPEVSRLELRYFDGTALYETWDTELMEGQLPRAIEVRMWFSQERTDDGGEAIVEEAPLPHVLTIALPSTWNVVDADVVGASATSETEESDSTSSDGGGGR